MIFTCTLTSIRLGFRRGCSGVTVGAEEGPGSDIGTDGGVRQYGYHDQVFRMTDPKPELLTTFPKGMAWE